jgi:hypothetical protein
MRPARTAVVALMTLTVLSCAHDAERSLLSRFFAASRLRDLTALSRIATVVFEPASDGIATGFEILTVSDRGTSKDLSISATVKLPDGRTVVKTYAVTIQGGLVTAISERPAPASTPRP